MGRDSADVDKVLGEGVGRKDRSPIDGELTYGPAPIDGAGTVDGAELKAKDLFPFQGMAIFYESIHCHSRKALAAFLAE